LELTLSQQISNFLKNTNYNSIPNEVINKAKQCLLDVIGVTLYSSKFKTAQIALNLMEGTGGKKKATTLNLNENKKYPCFLAALANGIQAHIADYDDVLSGFGHPSCILMPTTLALTEAEGKSGQELITAFILGSEVGSKLGIIMGRNHYNIGFHSTSTIGTIAAAAAAAKILDLSALQITNTLGIAASSASGIRQNFGTMTKSWHTGHAASMGIIAAILAKDGFDSSIKALDGETGFVNAFQGEKNIYPIDQLGKSYSLMNVQFKRYPSCAMTHPSVDAVLKLIKENNISFNEIKKIECNTSSRAKSVLIYKKPNNLQQAKFSLEYCVAAVVVAGNLGIDQFTDEFFSRQEVKAIMERVHVSFSNPLLDRILKEKNIINPSQVKVTLSNGKQFELLIEEAKGGPRNPLSWSELEEKFFQCTREVLSIDQARKFICKIKQLETISNINELLCCLIPLENK